MLPELPEEMRCSNEGGRLEGAPLLWRALPWRREDAADEEADEAAAGFSVVVVVVVEPEGWVLDEDDPELRWLADDEREERRRESDIAGTLGRQREGAVSRWKVRMGGKEKHYKRKERHAEKEEP